MNDINPKGLDVKIIVSESVETRGEGLSQTMSVINPKLRLGVPFIPTNLSFYITLLASKVESGNHKIVMNITSLLDSSVVFESGSNSVTVPDGTDEFYANVDLRNLTINTEGKYQIEFQLDDGKFYETFSIKING